MRHRSALILLCLVGLLAKSCASMATGATADDLEYVIGAGIADVTGPAADINLMGYAKPSQDAGGIHLRIYARSVIIGDRHGNKILYTSLDNGMISQLLRMEVLKKLKTKFGPTMFNETNVMLSATHTHSAPGGFFQYLLYNIPSAGFIPQTLNALVDGIVRSVERAHANIAPGKIYFTQGKLYEASINRSPTSYVNNPQEERARYEDNTDKTMYLLRMVDEHDEPIAMLNWFAVHGTSMNNSNHLISSDNKGYAALLFEQEFNAPGTLPGKGKFVAIFAQANEGDVSPNTGGPRCIDTGLPCDFQTSTCGNPPRNEKCIASGPGRDMFESTKIIAYKQYLKARQLFTDTSSQRLVSGRVRYIHEHIDMTQQVVPLYKSVLDLSQRQRNKRSIQLNDSYATCKPALGYSFAAGTTDGPGAFDFTQGDTASSNYWNMVRDFLRRPSEELAKCHQPKPIILATGEMDFPSPWHPKIIPTQLFMIGHLVIVGLPGEFTTMSGRRVREAVETALRASPVVEDLDSDQSSIWNHSSKQTVSSASWTRKLSKRSMDDRDNQDYVVVLSGLSNIYSSYITTFEEYEVQRYEGASTLYGPHTLQAYVNQFKRLASHLVSGQPLVPNRLEPPDLTKSLFSMKPGVIFDGAPTGKKFGSVLTDANVTRLYRCGEVVNISFVAGNPRNDLRQEDSFLYIDKLDRSGKTWIPIATDSSWETKFIWERTSTLYGESRAVVEWEIPHECQTGVYRVRHYGASKSLFQTISQYSGKSSPFKVVGSDTAKNTRLEDLEREYQEALELETAERIEEIRKREMNLDGPSVSSTGNQEREKRGFMRSLSPMRMVQAWLNWRWH